MDTIHEDVLTLTAPDGTPLTARCYSRDSAHRGVVIAGALAVPQRFYAPIARFLAERGAAVITVDYRGIGASRHGSLRGHPAQATDWIADLEVALQAALRRFEPLPVVALTHSFGGQVLPLTRGADRLERVVTVGTQFAKPNRWQGLDRLRMEAVFRVLLPVLPPVFGYLPGWTGIGEDVPAGVITEWARWCRSDRYLLDHVEGSEAAYERFDVPVDAFAIDDDDYAPLSAVEAFARELQGATIFRVTASDFGLDRLGHFVPFRPPAREFWVRLATHLGLGEETSPRLSTTPPFSQRDSARAATASGTL